MYFVQVEVHNRGNLHNHILREHDKLLDDFVSIKCTFHFFITSCVCSRCNVFILPMCLCVCVFSLPPAYVVNVMFLPCMCVCLSVWAINFERVDIETSFLVWLYILTISRSSLSIKVIGSRSK